MSWMNTQTPFPGRIGRAVLFCTLFVLAGSAGCERSLFAQVSENVTLVARSTDGPPTVAAHPWQDDAALFDVQFVNSRLGWAVGEHGVIWHSRDGGLSWQLVPSPVSCALRSVCFLTDRVGWIAGGKTTPHTRVSEGTVLATTDGGVTWTELAQQKLPSLHAVRFFNMQHGIVAGETSPNHPAGLLFTRDGGKTWHDAVGTGTPGWNVAEFRSLEVGLVAGVGGRVALVDSGELRAPRVPPLGLRTLHDIQSLDDRYAWLVGDSGFVLMTDNGGVSWQEPPNPLPASIRDCSDFHAVACHGTHVWVAGSPGSVVWHSPDSGRTWLPSSTGQTVPIRKLAFASDTTGWAVGELGMILRTVDGGRTWQAVRGGGRRAAWMGVYPQIEQVSFPAIAQLSGDEGYRGVVLLPSRSDVAPDGRVIDNRADAIRQAVTQSGGATALFDWQFPLSLPELDRQSDQLIAQWNEQTEGRLAEVMLARLVARIRSWRPNVILLQSPDSQHAVTGLIDNAVVRAVQQAADPTRYPEQLQLLGLQPWDVNRMFVRLPAGSTGQLSIDPDDLLPRLEVTAAMAGRDSWSLISGESAPIFEQEAYRLREESSPSAGRQFPRSFFAGLALGAGSDARRELTAINDDRYQQALKLAQSQRNLLAYSRRFLNDPQRAAQLLAQFDELSQGMPEAQAALQLQQLAEQYQRNAQWDLVEATRIELVERFPRHPIGYDAMRWLIQYWSSQEIAWQRVLQTRLQRAAPVFNPQETLDRISRAMRLAASEQAVRPVEFTAPAPAWEQQTGELKVTPEQNWRTGTVTHWQEQALRMSRLLRTQAEQVYYQPEVQFPLASLLRERAAYQYSDEIFRRFLNLDPQAAWRPTAWGEVSLLQPSTEVPRPIVVCHFTSSPPYLDGVLSDACWIQAAEIRLSALPGEDDNRLPHPFVQLAYDREHLYLAASFPRGAGTPATPPQTAERSHDADLTGFDRLQLALDIDRDYVTAYWLEVDQRGHSRDRCWDDATWNPKWFIAVDADDSRWRIEAAIPFSELVPTSPAPGTVWAMGLQRTVPATKVESWTHPTRAPAEPRTFGLLRFE